MPAVAPWVEITAAEQEAERNFAANQAALMKSQPELARLLGQVRLDLNWVYARDGSLSASHQGGQWWANCSVPLLAGRSLLKTLETSPTGSCLLAPAHAGLVRAAREHMGPAPVLFVVQPDVEIVRVILSCHDFSDEIVRNRLWLLCSGDWSDEFNRVFADHPGLALPTRFIRTKLTGEEITAPMIAAAQEVFTSVMTDRAGRLVKMQAECAASTDARKILLIGGSEFHLWSDGPAVLRDQLLPLLETDHLDLCNFDTDEALSGSPLALLQAAGICGSVVSVDLCRADCNHLVSTEIAWITWITRPTVPAFEFAGPGDALVLADANWRALARDAGWPDDRVRVCGWPSRAGQPTRSNFSPELAMICDTRPIEIPATVNDFSSHRLLWTLIEEELAAAPLAVEQCEAYLADRAMQLNIDVAALDQSSFIHRLIIPAYQQGIARLLISAGLPVAVWGQGWSDLIEFGGVYRGRISNPDELQQAIGASAGLIYAWPERAAHPLDTTGKPIVDRAGRDRSQLIRSARQALAARMSKPAVESGNQLGKAILQLLKLNRS